MKKLLAVLAVAALAPSARAADVYVLDYDVDLTSYVCPVLCTPPGLTQCPGPGWSDGRKVATSGSSTTVTAVDSGAFALAAVGDAIVISPTTGITAPTIRRITAKASSDEVTVDAEIEIPAAGTGFTLWRHVVGGGADDGYWTFPRPAVGTAGGDAAVVVSASQISATGGLDYKIECRHAYVDRFSEAVTVVGTTNLAAAGAVARMFDKQFYDQCRVCLKVGTSDDDGVIVTEGVDDDIDFMEAPASFTITEGVNDDLDWTEDPAGTPNVCTVAIPAGAYTAATLKGAITTAMNAAACSPGNVYSATGGTASQFEIRRAAGADAFDLNWNTGANTATSIGPTIGFPTAADDTGATTYTGDELAVEYTATLTAGAYATGAALCTEVEDELNDAGAGLTYSCSYSAATDKITISATGDFDLPWATGTNTATSAKTLLGFANSDDTGADTYTSDVALGIDAANEVEKITVTVRR